MARHWRHIVAVVLVLCVVTGFREAQAQVQVLKKISALEGAFELHDWDGFGIALAGIGDLDGDGVPDLAVGAWGDDDGGSNRGAVWILFMNEDGTVERHRKISATEGGFTGTLQDGVHFGSAVARLGDLDGDGVTELAVGARADEVDGGSVWVLFLNHDGTVKAQQQIGAQRGGFTGTLDRGDRFGIATAGLDDLDGDGVPDLAVGAWGDDDGGSNRGAVWILFMNEDGTVERHRKISATEGGFTGTLQDGDLFGWAVARLGDLDGDGVTELAVGALLADDGGVDRGAVWLLFLNRDGTVRSRQKISATEGGFTGALSDAGGFGAAVAGLEDVNGDGVLDLAVGAHGDDEGGTDLGAVWYLLLNADGTVQSHRKISATREDLLLNDEDSFGRAIAVLGDLKGDGFTDLAVGASGDNDGGPNRGAVWVLAGTPLPPPRPTGLQADPDSARVTLSWTPTTDPRVVEYRIYQLSLDQGRTLVGTVPSGTEKFTDDTIGYCARQAYRITAVSVLPNADSLESELSNEVSTSTHAIRVVEAAPDTLISSGQAAFALDLSALFSTPEPALTYEATSRDPLRALPSVRGDDQLFVSLVDVQNGDTLNVDVAARDRCGVENMYLHLIIDDPPLVNILAATTEPQEREDLLLEADVSDNSGITAATLHVRQGGELAFEALSMEQRGSSIYEQRIPADRVTRRGIEYFITARAADGLSTRRPATGFFSVRINIPNPGLRIEPVDRQGGSQDAYRLISIPLDLDNKRPSAVLEDDLGRYDATRWRFFEPRPDTTFIEFPNTSDMVPGKAFWLLVRGGSGDIGTGPGLTNATAEPFLLRMQPGWNAVGNPFAFPIPASNLRWQNSQTIPELYAYDGGWMEEPVAEMRPFEGYMVFNDSTFERLIWIQPDLPSVPDSDAAEQLAVDWSIRIRAESGTMRDVDNVAAVAPGAACGLDVWDRPEPPLIGDYVSVAFPAGSQNRELRQDVRPASQQREEWDVVVRTKRGEPVDVSFDGVASIPADYGVWLSDEKAGIRQDLRKERTYRLTGGTLEAPRRLKLVVCLAGSCGKTVEVAETVPEDYQLRPNFPNPFNPATTIPYEVPAPGPVRIDVYNILGARIATLVDADLPAGRHAVVWDGRSDTGSVVAAGVYLVQFRAGDVTQRRKMLLIR